MIRKRIEHKSETAYVVSEIIPKNQAGGSPETKPVGGSVPTESPASPADVNENEGE